MAIIRSIIVVLVIAAAAPAFGSRMLLDDTTLSCMSTVTKDQNGQDLKISAVSALTQKRFNTVQSSVPSQGEAACLRMRVKCADGHNAQHCTQADYDAKATKWAYMLTVKPVCEYYKTTGIANGFVQDVYCCSTNGCNFDKALDSYTQMLEQTTRSEP